MTDEATPEDEGNPTLLPGVPLPPTAAEVELTTLELDEAAGVLDATLLDTPDTEGAAVAETSPVDEVVEEEGSADEVTLPSDVDTGADEAVLTTADTLV